ncbi:MAG: tRNA (N(6)-L-threonylcarbamoyladenosine(37)-C(2))-methylthiotransferase MtaB [Bryobacteraceae bacterium]
MRRYYIHSFGCRASQADGVALASTLEAKGFAPTEDTTQAHLVVLNTCTVTSAADDEARQLVRRIHRSNPEARILVTGCYAQRAPEELAGLPGVSWVVGNSHKALVGEILDAQAPYHSQVYVGDIYGQSEFTGALASGAGGRTRPILKIQDGCNNRCSFCVIPSVRGPSRSAPPDRVVAEVRGLAEKYREIVLSGINLGRWGRDLIPRLRLADIVRRLLAETGVERLRLSSVEPMDWSDDLLGLVAESPRLAKFMHAPLQSGSDAVLRRMKRRYRARHYADRLSKARRWMPDAAIGADVMTGFPGETEAEFEESRRFIESMPFTYLHVFTYSERPGTPAADTAPVPRRVRKERTHLIRQISASKNLDFRQNFAGRTLSVVTLPEGALSHNYLRVELATPRPPNLLVNVEIGAVTPNGLREQNPFTVL